MFARPLTVTLVRLASKMPRAQILAIRWTGLPVRVKKDVKIAAKPQKRVVRTTHRMMYAVRIIILISSRLLCSGHDVQLIENVID